LGYNTDIHGNVAMKHPHSYFRQTKMTFFQKQRLVRQNRSCVGVGTSEKEEDIGKGVGGEYGGNIMHPYMKMEK
jgi:hypothetical protein